MLFQLAKQRVKIRFLIDGGIIQLTDLTVDFLDQVGMLLGQFQIGIEIFRCRSAHAEQTFLFVRFFYIGDDADLLLEFVEFHETIFEVIDLLGEFLDLHPLVLDFLGLEGEFFLDTCFMREYVLNAEIIINAVSHHHGRNDKNSHHAEEFAFGAMELFYGLAGTTQDDEGELVRHIKP